MFMRALLAFLALPGSVAIIAPLLLAAIDPWRGTPWLPGTFVICLGAFVLVWCGRDFYLSGKGTLAPWDPPRKLVVIGLYRFVRNPMYIGVLLLVTGWTLYFRSPVLLLYTILLAVAFHIRVVKSEEPWLAAHFGEPWQAYQQGVSRWWPRRTPWQGDD